MVSSEVLAACPAGDEIDEPLWIHAQQQLMPSPIAHSLAGVSIAWLATPTGDATAPRRSRLLWAAACVFAANAPDLDFVGGLLAGSVNAFHGGPTHSLTVAVLFGGLAAVAAGRLSLSAGHAFAVLGLAYASHVGLDLMSGFVERPNTLAVFWPFSAVRYTAPWHPFPGILHGPPGGDLAGFLDEFLSLSNLRAVAVEATLGIPLAAAVWLTCRSVRTAERPKTES